MPARTPIYELSIYNIFKIFIQRLFTVKKFCLLLFNRLQFCQHHNLGFHERIVT